MMNRKQILLACSVSLLMVSGGVAAPVDFNQQIKPMLESACIACHRADKANGGYRMDEHPLVLQGGEDGVAVVPGDPEKSPLYKLTVLPKDDDDIMPPKGAVLNKWQTDIIAQWIKEGAKWPAGAKLEQKQRIDFVKDIKPIFEFNCVACHREGHDKGGLRMETAELTFKGGDNGTGVVPFDPKGSSIYESIILPEDDDDLMPPKNKGGPLPKDKIELVREWIAQGANWPEGVVLEPKKAEDAAQWTDVSTSEQIHAKIIANLDVKDASGMKAYTDAIPGTPVSFEMLAIPGGVYTMGSPASEAGRKDDEGPQHKATIEPFWMGKFEVTWNEYELFMYPEGERKPIAPGAALNTENVPDAVTRPTKPYVEMSFGMGKDGYPAISMTHHAAMTYCKWLSAKTGKFYRLPTETEWEYACRAGTTTAYSFGDDASQLKDYAWYAKNSDFKYQKVGKKKSNPWGLFDMHGNVVEWCIDQYDADFYKQFAAKAQLNDWKPSSTPYPHVTRGGSWDDDDVAVLRSAARRASNPSWKQQDPQLPKSIWYLTDAQFLGFRVVRPLKVPSAQEIHKWWTNGVEVE